MIEAMQYAIPGIMKPRPKEPTQPISPCGHSCLLYCHSRPKPAWPCIFSSANLVSCPARGVGCVSSMSSSQQPHFGFEKAAGEGRPTSFCATFTGTKGDADRRGRITPLALLGWRLRLLGLAALWVPGGPRQRQ